MYVLLGKDGGLGKEIDPANGNTVMEFHFYGVDPGDQLGAAVACADLNGDHVGDLIVAAPGAALGAGRVYAVFGNQAIRGQAITPGSTGADAPDVTWATAVDMGLGSILFAADLNGDDKAEILVASAPRSKKVHLLKNVIQHSAAPIVVDGPDHITFSGVGATAIAAGNLRHIPGGVDVVIGDSSGMRPTVTMGGGAIFGFADVKLDSAMQYTTPSMTMYGGDNMLFGAALLALATTSAGQDLIVGAPGVDNGTGAFYLYKGDSNFFGVTERAMDDHVVPKARPSTRAAARRLARGHAHRKPAELQPLGSDRRRAGDAAGRRPPAGGRSVPVRRRRRLAVSALRAGVRRGRDGRSRDDRRRRRCERRQARRPRHHRAERGSRRYQRRRHLRRLRPRPAVSATGPLRAGRRVPNRAARLPPTAVAFTWRNCASGCSRAPPAR